MQKEAAAIPRSWFILNVYYIPERIGVYRSTSMMSWSRLDCNCYYKCNDLSRPSNAETSAHAFSRHVMWQLKLPHSLERIPTAITDRILFSDYITGTLGKYAFSRSKKKWYVRVLIAYPVHSRVTHLQALIINDECTRS